MALLSWWPNRSRERRFARSWSHFSSCLVTLAIGVALAVAVTSVATYIYIAILFEPIVLGGFTACILLVLQIRYLSLAPWSSCRALAGSHSFKHKCWL